MSPKTRSLLCLCIIKMMRKSVFSTVLTSGFRMYFYIFAHFRIDKCTILSTVLSTDTRRFVQKAVHFYDFSRSGLFSDKKSLFFRSCSELPRVDYPSRSEAENHCFSASTSIPLIFRDIFVRSPSRNFRWPHASTSRRTITDIARNRRENFQKNHEKRWQHANINLRIY